MTEKVDLKDMIVILPGIMGSVLEKDGKVIWGFSGQAFWQMATSFGKTISSLKLVADDPEAEDLEDGIKATKLMKDVHIAGLKIIDGYTRITKLITDNFNNVTQGNIYEDSEDKAANLYHFPYDWRRDNRISALILEKKINQRLKRWREYSGNQNAKVILLAHSMGGLVSRYYLEVLGGWKDCKALFTFGTPYRGSLNAVNILANGFKKGGIDLTEVMNLKEVISSLTSIYQLLPRYKVLKIDSDFYRIGESPVKLPNIDPVKAKNALEFHDKIDNAADANKDNSTYHNSFVTCPIVGVVQPTMQSAELQNGVITTSYALPTWLSDRPHFGDGDGTVPQVSATPVQMNDREMLSIVDYIAEGHGALQNQPDALLNLLKVIQSSQTASSGDVRGSLDNIARGKRSGITGIGLSLDDVYLLQEPITMRAKVAGNATFNSLRAEISCISHDRPIISRDFIGENGSWVMTTGALKAGLYKVKVQTDSTSEDGYKPVHNLFEVVDLTQGE